ncbi:MAG TPA: serine hydrolase [Pyrinomonadaceae bacterium]|nr:serine hydrolase [Pyrinomonadaceae bacterium]
MPIAIASQTTSDKIPIKKADRVKKKTVRQKAVHLPQNRTAQQSNTYPKALKESFHSDASIREMIRENIPDAQSTGVVVGLLEPDGRRRVIAYGGSGLNAPPLDGESVFEIGSITKVFTGVLLADMVRRGEVKLSEPLARLLPNVNVPSRNGKEITLLDLATHTSGLPTMPGNFPKSETPKDYADYTVREMYDFLSGYKLTRDPGQSDQYSNFASLTGHALALIAGKSYEALLRERVLLPLKMNQTAITLTPELQKRFTSGHDRFGESQPYFIAPAFIPSGGLKSTVNDMLDFAAANLKRNNTGINAALKDSHRPQRPLGDSGEFWGLGWGVDSINNEIGHSGNTFGYNGFININLKRRRAIVVLSNISGNNANTLGIHLLYPEKYPLKKPSIGLAVAAIYRSKGVNKAIEHYRSLLGTARNLWNFEETEINDFGYWLLKRKSNKDAIAVFRLNVEMYPESPNSHDSLGDAYRAANQLNEAIESYRKAVGLAEKSNHPSLASYSKSLESTIKQLNSQK